MTANEKKLMSVITDAVAGLERANNPHVVKVRENLRKELTNNANESVERYKATQEFFEDTE